MFKRHATVFNYPDRENKEQNEAEHLKVAEFVLDHQESEQDKDKDKNGKNENDGGYKF